MPHNYRILAVDDDPAILNTLTVLNSKYEVIPLPTTELALRFLKNNDVDLILSDYYIGEVTGFNFYDMVKTLGRNNNVPVIFLTGASEDEIEITALEKGAIDYISKPIIIPLLFKRVETALKIYTYLKNLESIIEKRTDEIKNIHKKLENTCSSIFSLLANSIHTRDEGTGIHVKHTMLFSKIITDELLKQGKLQEKDALDIVDASCLHDIGKIGIKDDILLKPGRLTDEEFEEIKKHPVFGADMLYQYLEDENASMFKTAYDIVLYHHEKWDGSGYPNKLRGEEIPLSARVTAVVDVYDALISERIYKKAMSHMEAAKIIIDGSGSLFDPEIVEIFKQKEDEFRLISETEKEKEKNI